MPVFGPIHVGETITIKANPTDALGVKPARMEPNPANYGSVGDIWYQIAPGSDAIISASPNGFPSVPTCTFTGLSVGNALVSLRAFKPGFTAEVILTITIQVIAAVIPGPGEIDHFEPEVV